MLIFLKSSFVLFSNDIQVIPNDYILPSTVNTFKATILPYPSLRFVFKHHCCCCCCCRCCCFSRVWLLATPWTAAHQPPPSMGVSRQEYWSGVPLPSPMFIKRTGKGSRQKLLNTSKLIHQSNNWLQLFYLYKERVGKFHGYFPSSSNTPGLCGLFFQGQVQCVVNCDSELV